MSKKTLIVFSHPFFEKSRSNRAMLEVAKTVPNVTIHPLYENHQNFKFDIPAEQKLLREHDSYVLQFPFYWYSSPALLKEWMDAVLQYGFAFGKDGGALKGRSLSLAITTGSAFEDYLTHGKYRTTVEELVRPFQLTAEFCGMKYVKPYVVHGIKPSASGGPTDEQLKKQVESYADFLKTFGSGST